MSRTLHVAAVFALFALAAASAQQPGLHQQLPKNLGAAGAQRSADRNISLPDCRARRDKIRQIRTRNSQDESHSREQHPQRSLVPAHNLVGEVQHPRRCVFCIVGGIEEPKPFGDPAQFGGRLLNGRRLGESSEHTQKI